MMSYYNYGLTEYQDFRTLQFNFVKLRDQNIQLKAKLFRIQVLYQELTHQNNLFKSHRKQLIQMERQRQKNKGKISKRQNNMSTPQKQFNGQKDDYSISNHKFKQSHEKCQKIPSQIFKLIQETIQKLKKSDEIVKMSEFKSLISKAKNHNQNLSFDEDQSSPQKLSQQNSLQQDLLRKYIVNSASILTKLDRKNQQLQAKINQKSTLAHKLEQQRDLRQEKLIIDMNDLQKDLQKLQALRIDITAQNNYLQEQNEVLKMKLTAIQRINNGQQPQTNAKTTIAYTEQNASPGQQSIQDHNFAIDFINFQKQLLKRIFLKLANGFSNKQMSNSFKDVYQAFQQVVQAYKEKIQIQYDLQDLQCGYKKQKKIQNKGTANLLIDIRKKIQTFRAQLHQQNQIFYQKQYLLEQKIAQLQAQEAHETKMKHYTLQIQKKLQNKQKKITDYKSKNKFYKENQNQNQHFYEQEQQFQEQNNLIKKQNKYRPDQIKTLLNIKHTSQSDQLVKQLVKKDRQNFQRILKQTRQKYMTNN